MLLFPAIFGISQSLLAEFPAIVKGTKIDNLLLANGLNGEMSVCYTTPYDFVIRTFDEQGTTLYQNSAPLKTDNLIPMGGIDTGEAFHFFYFKKKGNQYFEVKAHKNDEKPIEMIELSPFQKNDRSIANFVSDNECYVVAWDKLKNILKFGRFDKTLGKFDIKEKTMSAVFMEKLDKADITLFSNTTIPEPVLAHNKYKMYRQPDGRVAITIEGGNYLACQTEILLIDFEKGRLKYAPIGKGIGREAYVRPTSSFIFGDHIALVRSEKKLLEIEIRPLDSLNQTIRQYSFTEDDSIHIMNSDLITEKSQSASLVDTRDISSNKSKKILKKMSGGEPFIYFEGLSNGDYLFTIGNYTEQSNNGPMFMPMPGFGGVAGVFTAAPGLFMTYGQSYSMSRFFYAILDGKEFSPKAGNAKSMDFLSKKVNAFVDDNIIAKKGLFERQPEYQLLRIPNTTNALIISYLKSEGTIKLHKIST
jgi:hypothetical protein